MPCQHVPLPGGGAAIVCGPRQPSRRCSCGAPAPLLCDWKVPTRKSGTCDKPICADCRWTLTGAPHDIAFYEVIQ